MHFEPVEGNFFGGMDMPADLKSLEDDWFGRWAPVEENMSIGDEETALEKMFEIVFEMEPGGYANERESIRLLTRQNARTLAANFSNFDSDEIKMDCNYLSKIKTPTLVLHGELTHGYWQQMAKRVSECQPNTQLAMIKGANHYAPLQEIEQMTAAVLSFVDAHE